MNGCEIGCRLLPLAAAIPAMARQERQCAAGIGDIRRAIAAESAMERQ